MAEPLETLLQAPVAYYRAAVAQEYEDHALPFAGGDELVTPTSGPYLWGAGNPDSLTAVAPSG